MLKVELEEKLKDLGPPPALDSNYPTPDQVYHGLLWVYDKLAIFDKFLREHKSLGGGR